MWTTQGSLTINSPGKSKHHPISSLQPVFRDNVLSHTINVGEKEHILPSANATPTHANGIQSQLDSYKTQNLSEALNSLRKQTSKNSQVFSSVRNGPNFRTVASTPKNRKMTTSDEFQADTVLARQPASSINFKNFEVKPRLLESKITEDENFMRITDGFRRVFSNDREDQRLVLPISGYGGHRRGDRSQNFFGKPFREIGIQSKRL